MKAIETRRKHRSNKITLNNLLSQFKLVCCRCFDTVVAATVTTAAAAAYVHCCHWLHKCIAHKRHAQYIQANSSQCFVCECTCARRRSMTIILCVVFPH